eukprot:scaffold627_cov123-Isochrysis_galbana.AAC.4
MPAEYPLTGPTARVNDESAASALPSACSLRARWNQLSGPAFGDDVASRWHARPPSASPASVSSHPRRESSPGTLERTSHPADRGGMTVGSWGSRMLPRELRNRKYEVGIGIDTEIPSRKL